MFDCHVRCFGASACTDLWPSRRRLQAHRELLRRRMGGRFPALSIFGLQRMSAETHPAGIFFPFWLSDDDKVFILCAASVEELGDEDDL